ncbi:MAG: hypothetical protein ACRD6X_03060, partial [Pyrinomonadaceae bacterium]
PRNKPKKDNFAVTRAATGVMESRDSDSIVIALENGEELKLDISSKTRFVGDPQIGQRVRVTYQTKDRRATVVRKL